MKFTKLLLFGFGVADAKRANKPAPSMKPASTSIDNVNFDNPDTYDKTLTGDIFTKGSQQTVRHTKPICELGGEVCKTYWVKLVEKNEEEPPIEIEIAKKIQRVENIEDNGIMPVHAIRESSDGTHVYLVMPDLNARTLKDELQAQIDACGKEMDPGCTITKKQLQGYVKGIYDGFKVLHDDQNHYIQFDNHLEQVLLTQSGTVLLIDFERVSGGMGWTWDQAKDFQYSKYAQMLATSETAPEDIPKVIAYKLYDVNRGNLNCHWCERCTWNQERLECEDR